MAPVTAPVFVVGLATCLLLEFSRWFGYGVELCPAVREVLQDFARHEDEIRTPKQWAAIIVQAATAVFLCIALALHLAEVGVIGLCVIVLATAFTGITSEHQIGHAFEEALPFTSLLVVFFASRWGWFPLAVFTSVDFEDYSLWEKVKDLLHHTALPLACYLVHAFAFVTMLMKNHLMDNLAADYIRTALAKGVSYGEAVRRHALRNSMIPIATNLGHQVMLFVAGSFLIEKIFNIDGFGLLGFNSVIDRDYPVVMGVLLLSASLMLLGNILSDILVALVDPRVRFK